MFFLIDNGTSRSLSMPVPSTTWLPLAATNISLEPTPEPSRLSTSMGVTIWPTRGSRFASGRDFQCQRSLVGSVRCGEAVILGSNPTNISSVPMAEPPMVRWGSPFGQPEAADLHHARDFQCQSSLVGSVTCGETVILGSNPTNNSSVSTPEPPMVWWGSPFGLPEAADLHHIGIFKICCRYDYQGWCNRYKGTPWR